MSSPEEIIDALGIEAASVYKHDAVTTCQAQVLTTCCTQQLHLRFTMSERLQHVLLYRVEFWLTWLFTTSRCRWQR